jgi:uncharacterized protein with HEPN domain
MKDDRLYLIHIQECINRIESYIAECGRDNFFTSTLIQDAVIRNLQIMAESTQRLSDELKESHPEIEWSKVSGFRNVLAHDYLGIDLSRIWLILEDELPILKQTISAMIAELG